VRYRVTALSIVVSGDEPPSEFRIFTAGQVETTKGTFVFDEDAAAAVMADYQAHGIDLMVDYDHAALGGTSADPALASRAAGWFNLEVRGGELWAVNVRWTPNAAQALRNREWRFMSPAFEVGQDKRITSLLNVALTNIPATRRLTPLMAANKGGGMSVEEFIKVCKALGIDMSSSLEDAMAKIKGEPAKDKSDAPADKPADAPAPEAAAETAAPPAKEEEKPEAVAAAASRLMRLSGAESFVGAVAEVEVWRASHIKLETETARLAAERAVLEAAKRREMVAELVKLGAEFPSTVWADDSATKIKSRWLAMSMADLEAHVSEQRAARGGKAPPPKTPVGGTVDANGLDARELQICKETGCDPKTFAMLKSRRTA